MTEEQNELYARTKERMRRLGKENPADVIVALAEEIEYYRKKIQAMDEFISKRSDKQIEPQICAWCGQPIRRD